MKKEHVLLLPELGEGVIEGELQKWQVKVGDTIQEDDVVAEVMTDKASVEVPSTYSGTVKELKVKEGQACFVGKPLLILVSEVTELKEEALTHQSIEKTESTGMGTEATQTNDSSLISQEVCSQQMPALFETSNHLKESSVYLNEATVLATPMVRKKAKENKIDLSKIKGTGLSGRITLDDVNALISPQSVASVSNSTSLVNGFQIPTEEGQKRIPLKGVRKKIAQKMQVSKNVIPHFSLMDQAFVEELVKLRERAKKTYPDIKITYLSFVIKILYNCLRDFPELNASIDDVSQEIVYKNYFHIGFATDTPRGLLVPVIRDVDQKSVVQISQEIVRLSTKARDAKISVDEIKGATITVTNLGSIAGQWATPIINAPEVSILGMYKMFEQAVWNGESFQPKKTMNFSLTSDHRLIDGAVAARFMKSFIERVQNPSLILLEN